MTLPAEPRIMTRRTMLLVLLLAGLACGLTAVAFHELIALSRALLIEPALRAASPLREVLIVAIPSAMAALLGFVVQHFAPRAVGANLARVRRSYAEDPNLLDPRTVIATFILTPLSLGAGAPLGPEGPTIVSTSGVSIWLARMLRLPKRVVRAMIPVGTAAGIAAIFRTPITGVVFALEELLGTTSRGVLGGTIVAAVAAATVDQALLGSRRILPLRAAEWSHVFEIAGFAAVGLCAGIVSALAIRAATSLRRPLRQKIPSLALRGALGGACVGLVALAQPSILGVGYDVTSFLVRGGGSLTVSGLAFAAKLIAFVIAIAAGLLGGTFAPSLFIGSALGSFVGYAVKLVAPTVDPGAYALVGMGAYFAGTLRAPIAAVLIVLELTNDYGLVVPLMAAVAISNFVSHAIARRTIEDEQLVDEGFEHRPESRDPLEMLTVREVMTTKLLTFAPDVTVESIVAATRETRHRQYPIVDESGRLIGMVAGRAVAEAVRGQRRTATARDLMSAPGVVAKEPERLHEVLRRLAAAGHDRCAVVDDEGRLAGFIAPSDLVRARFREHEVSAVID